MSEISPQTKNLIQQYQEWYQSTQKKTGATIHVDEVASRVAAFYEKVRGIVDWREEHLLRRGAIERILKRRLFLRAGQKLDATSFVMELIRAGHFPNDKVEESKIETIQKTLDKYIYIVEKSPKTERERSKMHLQDWLSSVAACEVEEILDPPRKEKILINYMAELMEERIQLKNNLSKEEKYTQIQIAVQKALYKLDPPIISYHLMVRQVSNWKDLSVEADEKILKEATENIYSIWEDVENKLKNPLSEKFYRICARHVAPFLVLGDVLSQDPPNNSEKFAKPELLENEIKNFYQIRQTQQKSKVSRTAFYSTLSIFVTKITLALGAEYPIDKYVLGNPFNPVTMALSVLIPPVLMIFLILSIKPPKKDNLGKVMIEIMKIIYVSKEKDIYTVKTSYNKNFLMRAIIFIIYAITFVGTFLLIWYLLGLTDFSWPSKIILILFLSLISFAGTKLQERSKELSVEAAKSGFFGFILDWFSLPFVQLGKWLSGQWTKYNFFVVILITLVDLPFQVFVELLEQWRSFVREKREEIH